MPTQQGSCHCGAIEFEIETDDIIEVIYCNCSICTLTSYEHVIVDKSAFQLISGQNRLTSYQFNTKEANHLFCSICGVKSFYQPRSHPEGVSVNFRCFDKKNIGTIRHKNFDGQNWEKNIATISDKE